MYCAYSLSIRCKTKYYACEQLRKQQIYQKRCGQVHHNLMVVALHELSLQKKTWRLMSKLKFPKYRSLGDCWNESMVNCRLAMLFISCSTLMSQRRSCPQCFSKSAMKESCGRVPCLCSLVAGTFSLSAWLMWYALYVFCVRSMFHVCSSCFTCFCEQ